MAIPTELHLKIFESMDEFRTKNAFARTSRQLYQLLNHDLYRLAVTMDLRVPSATRAPGFTQTLSRWAAMHTAGDALATLAHLLAAGLPPGSCTQVSAGECEILGAPLLVVALGAGNLKLARLLVARGACGAAGARRVRAGARGGGACGGQPRHVVAAAE